MHEILHAIPPRYVVPLTILAKPKETAIGCSQCLSSRATLPVSNLRFAMSLGVPTAILTPIRNGKRLFSVLIFLVLVPIEVILDTNLVARRIVQVG